MKVLALESFLPFKPFFHSLLHLKIDWHYCFWVIVCFTAHTKIGHLSIDSISTGQYNLLSTYKTQQAVLRKMMGST